MMKYVITRALPLLVLAALGPACGNQSRGGASGGAPASRESLWAAQNPDNVAITTVGAELGWDLMVSDGAGGAIVAWQDSRAGVSVADIYAQRVDASGTVRWTINGLGIETNSWSEDHFRMAADGAGGALFVWDDFRNGTNSNVFAQRINGDGVRLWATEGKAVTTGTWDARVPNLLADGAGGAIVVWQDSRGADTDIYAQHINGAGDGLWTPNGLPVTTATGAQASPQLVADGAGGTVIVWVDNRTGVDADLYGQRIDANGAPQWTAGGVALTTATGNQLNPRVASDGSGGVIAIWEDNRSGVYTDIYAGRLTGAGTAPWTTDGVAISTAPGYQTTPRIVSDGAGGAILAWYDENGGPAVAKVYAQRLNPAGTTLWTVGGVAMSSTTGRQSNPDMISDGAGGAVIAWQDNRNFADIYAQRLDASGTPLWTANGVGVCTLGGGTIQQNPALVPNGFGGAVISWGDTRPTSAGFCIYAQGVSSNGQE